MKLGSNKSEQSLFSVLARFAPNKVFLSLVLGVLAGLAYSLVIPLILLSLEEPSHRLLEPQVTGGVYVMAIEVATPKFALVFLSVCLFVLLTRVISEALLVRVATDAMVELRKSLYKRISYAPIQDVERIGSSRFLSVLTTDVPRVVNGASLLPSILVSTATVLGLLGYLVYLNQRVFMFIMACLVVGVVTYRIPFYLGDRCYTKARECFDGLQEGMRGLIFGAKELKLDSAKREGFLDHELYKYEGEFCLARKRAETLMTFAISYGDLISFFVIGIVTYALANYYGMSAQGTVGIVMALLYISSPLGVILNTMVPAMKANVSLRKVNLLLDELPPERSWQQQGRIDCNELILHRLFYQHAAPDNEENGFQIGPIDLTLRSGEVTFLVGGNGSGKTTLGKLISLHYLPTAGQIFFDKIPVGDTNRQQCRHSIGAIYSDFHLFARLFLDPEQLRRAEPKIQRYLKKFQLDEKVKIENGEFSTLALSDGQRRRLALLVTFLEDRNIYVFDEWAADQDPASRDIFYKSILPDLRNAGKMVIIISHDDRYFPTADRVLRMEDGQLIDESSSATSMLGID